MYKINPIQIFTFFCTNTTDSGIEDQNVEYYKDINYSSPMSYDWFQRVWKSHFPFLYCESETPQCTECHDSKMAQKQALSLKDLALFHNLKAKQGIFKNFILICR